eukprot:350305_1
MNNTDLLNKGDGERETEPSNPTDTGAPYAAPKIQQTEQAGGAQVVVVVPPQIVPISQGLVSAQPMEPFEDLTLWSVLACLLCAFPCGIVAIVLACNAKTAYRENRTEEYRESNKNTKICLWISLITGVIVWIIIVIDLNSRPY